MKYKTFILIIISLSLFLLTITSALATLEDDFNRANSGTLGTATNGNTWTTGANWELLDGRAYDSDLAAGDSRLKLSATNPNRIDYEFEVSSTGGAYYVSFPNEDAVGSISNSAIFFSINGGNLRYYSSGWKDFDTTFTPSINTKYVLSVRDIDYVTNTYDVYIDDVIKETNAPFTAAVGIKYINVDGRVNNAYIDCIVTDGTLVNSTCGLVTNPEDDFGRADTSTLGTASNGNTWSETSSAYADFEIVDNKLVVDTTGNAASNLNNVIELDVQDTNPRRVDLIGFNITAYDGKTFCLGTTTAGMCSSATDQAIQIQVGIASLGNSLNYYNGGWIDSTYDVPLNTLINISLRNINYETNTFDIYVDNTLYKTSATFRNDVGIETFSMVYTSVSGSDRGDLNVNCITINGNLCGEAAAPPGPTPLGNTNFSTPSSVSYSFDTPLSIGTAYGVVNSLTFNNTIGVTTPFYFATSITSFGGTATAECRLTIDGNEEASNTRSLSLNTYGNIALVSPSRFLSLGEHTLNTECRKVGGSNYIVNNSQLTQFTLYDSQSNEEITSLSFDDAGPIALTTTDSHLGSFEFNTSNTTNTTNNNYLITQGVVNYNYGASGDITTYFVIEETGETCGPYTRGGLAGNTGSVGASCAFSDLNSSTTYNLSLYGYTSVGTGSLTDLASNLFEIKLNETAQNIEVLNFTMGPPGLINNSFGVLDDTGTAGASPGFIGNDIIPLYDLAVGEVTKPSGTNAVTSRILKETSPGSGDYDIVKSVSFVGDIADFEGYIMETSLNYKLTMENTISYNYKSDFFIGSQTLDSIIVYADGADLWYFENIQTEAVNKIAEINIANHLGGEYNIFSEASIIVNGDNSVGQDAYFYLSNSVNTSNFYRSINSRSGNIVIQNVFSETGTANKTISLYGYCPNGCNITGGSLNAFVTDTSVASTGTFNITAQNTWNSSTILEFNATIGGTTLTTTNGTITALGQGNVNVLVEAGGYFSNTTLHDTTTPLVADLARYTEFTANNFGTGGVTNFTINTTTDSYTTTNGVAYLPISSDNTSVTINGDTISGTTDLVNKTQTYAFSVYAENSLFITFKDSVTDSIINNVSMDYFSSLDSSQTSTNNGTLYLTLLNPVTYTFRINSSGYEDNLYFTTITDDTFSDFTIYLNPNASTTSITFQIVDSGASEVENAQVQALKYYVEDNTYRVIASGITNPSGETKLDLITENNFYKYVVILNGVVVKTTSPSIITATTIRIQVTSGDIVLEDYSEWRGITSRLTYNEVTSNFRLDYSDTTNRELCMSTYEEGFNMFTLLESTCVSGTSGTILQGIDNATSGTFFAVVTTTINGEQWVIAKETYSFKVLDLGSSGIVGQIFLTLLMSLSGAVAVELIFILAPLSIILGGLIGLHSLSLAFTLPLLVVGLILMFILRRNS